MDFFPVINHIDVLPVEHNGKKLICLRNPEVTELPPLLVSELTLHIIQYFDGRHSLNDIQNIFSRDYHVNLNQDNLGKLLEHLDNSLLLRSERYRDYMRKIEREFSDSSCIDPSHAGLCYPGDRHKLLAALDSYHNNTKETSCNKDGEKLTGIISPHIDFTRGWRSYVHAYRQLHNISAKTFIIMGTSHYADTENPYILTKKSFSTPLGTVGADTDLIDRIDEGCEWDIFENEIAYRAEHSIEFQVIFLQHILGNRNDYRIIPVLCNSFDSYINRGISPCEDSRISGFIDTLNSIENEKGDDIFYIAGVDMTHFGQKFGDDEPLDTNMLEWIRERDSKTLNSLSAMDPEGFYRSVEEEKDKRKICGLSSIYTLLKLLNGGNAVVLDYDRALERDSQSVVTYASAALFN